MRPRYVRCLILIFKTGVKDALRSMSLYGLNCPYAAEKQQEGKERMAVGWIDRTLMIIIYNYILATTPVSFTTKTKNAFLAML
jgi:hypothetical protein